MGQLNVEDGAVAVGPDGVGVEWAVASAPADGQTRSGDRHVVRPFDDGVLMIVIDALGHGSQAERVATAAVDAIQPASRESLSDIVTRCHRALTNTRGAVAAAAWLSAGAEMTWLAVGNAAAVLMRRRYGRLKVFASVTARPGIIGLRLPKLQEVVIAIQPGDLLLMATDGVDPDFDSDALELGEIANQAAALFRQHRIPADDGLLLAARYREVGGR